MIPSRSRPFLKWAGGKFSVLNKILSYLPVGERLVEPFTGSGAVFLNSSYEKYLLAEYNADLINLYYFVQEEGLVFIDYCKKLFSPENNSSEIYYQLRKTFNACTSKRKRAALFLYLNRHGYNGLCRYNSSGIYNVPFGRYEKVYFPYKELIFFNQKAAGVSIVQADFRETFSFAKEKDVIYCDPPYVPLSATASFSAYTLSGFSETDQLDLVRLAIESANSGIPVLISNHDTALTREYYKDGEIFSFPVNRFISCKSFNREPVQELVALFR